MKAMENKQKAIEKAYGEHWEIVKDCVDENGWINNNFYKFTFGQLKNLDSEYKDDVFFRPKSLQGIETNNGWIKIESEADLPKENGAYYIVRSDDFYKNDVQTFIYNNCDSFSKAIWKSCVTHYQPIEKPKPPIY